MKQWFFLGIGWGVVLTLFGLRLMMPPLANAQYLSKFQNVQFQFATTGATSTLAFFNRESGEVFLYVASGRGDFQLAKRFVVKELGDPLTQGVKTIPRLPTGVEGSH